MHTFLELIIEKNQIRVFCTIPLVCTIDLLVGEVPSTQKNENEMKTVHIFNTFYFVFTIKNMLDIFPPPLRGHLTFRILSLLRYVVDIGKSGPNPIFFFKSSEN